MLLISPYLFFFLLSLGFLLLPPCPVPQSPTAFAGPFPPPCFPDSDLCVGRHGFLTVLSASLPQTTALRDHSTRLAEKKTALIETMS